MGTTTRVKAPRTVLIRRTTWTHLKSNGVKYAMTADLCRRHQRHEGIRTRIIERKDERTGTCNLCAGLPLLWTKPMGPVI